MQDEASKPVVVAMLFGVAVGLTTHVWYGISLIANQGNGGGAALAAIAFAAVWLHLIVRCVQLPSGVKYRYDKSFPLFFSVFLPFAIPSAIALAVIATSDASTLHAVITMAMGLVLIIALSGFVWLCVLIRTSRRAHRDTETAR